MSNANIIKPVSVIKAGSMATNLISEITDMQRQDNACYQIVWSGTSLVGRFAVEFTNDDAYSSGVTPTWTELIMDGSTAVPADSGDAIFNINQNPGRIIRFHYYATSGTGVLNVTVCSKDLG